MIQQTITLTKNEKWISLSLSLGESLTNGKCAYIKGDFVCNIKKHSMASNNLGPKECGIGVLSGAPYAFRMLNSNHTEIIVHYLMGSFDEADFEIVSIASAIAIVDIMGGDSKQINTGEWCQERVNFSYPS